MKILFGKDLEATLRFAADGRRQTEGGRLLLTLMDVEQIMGEAKFGAEQSAGEEARRIKRPAVRRAGDARGHWELGQGTYWIAFNERVDVPDGALLVLQPQRDLLRSGVWHPNQVIRDWDRDGGGVLLVVSSRGVRIEEGTPISVGFILV